MLGSKREAESKEETLREKTIDEQMKPKNDDLEENNNDDLPF